MTTKETRRDEQAAGYTPGPWTVQDVPSCGLEVHWREPRPNELNAPVCHMRWTSGMHAETEARVLADAHLIAAAPDLFEALKDLVEVLRREAPGTPLNNTRFDALGIKANNALAKAAGTGRG